MRTHPEAWVRAQCAFRLASTTQDQVVLELIAALEQEVDAETITWIASTLARFGDYAGVHKLLVLGASHSAATEQLARIVRDAGVPDAAEVSRRWTYADPEHKLAGPAPSDRLLLEVWRRIAGFARPEDDREAADDERRLGSLPEWAAPILAEALADSQRNVRVRALRALRFMGPRGGTAGPTALSSLVSDPDPFVQFQAAVTLGALHYTPAAPELEKRLAPDRDVVSRMAAIQSLGTIDAPRCIPALERVLDPREDPELRCAAAIALLSYERADVAIPALSAALPAKQQATMASMVENAVRNWLAQRARAGNAAATRALERWNATQSSQSDAVARARTLVDLVSAERELVAR
jgi:HEAT repeat protein